MHRQRVDYVLEHRRLIDQLRPIGLKCGPSPWVDWADFIENASDEEMNECLDLVSEAEQIQFIRQKAAWWRLGWWDQLWTSYKKIPLPPLTLTTTTMPASSSTTTGALKANHSDQPIHQSPLSNTTSSVASYETQSKTTMATPTTSSSSSSSSSSTTTTTTTSATTTPSQSNPTSNVHVWDRGTQLRKDLFDQLRPAGKKCGMMVWVRFLGSASIEELWRCIGLPTEEARTHFIRQKVAWLDLPLDRKKTDFQTIQLPPLTDTPTSTIAPSFTPTLTSTAVSSTTTSIAPFKSDPSPPSSNFKAAPSAVSINQLTPTDESEEKDEDEDEDDVHQPLLLTTTSPSPLTVSRQLAAAAASEPIEDQSQRQTPLKPRRPYHPQP